MGLFLIYFVRRWAFCSTLPSAAPLILGRLCKAVCIWQLAGLALRCFETKQVMEMGFSPSASAPGTTSPPCWMTARDSDQDLNWEEAWGRVLWCGRCKGCRGAAGLAVLTPECGRTPVTQTASMELLGSAFSLCCWTFTLRHMGHAANERKKGKGLLWIFVEQIWLYDYPQK